MKRIAFALVLSVVCCAPKLSFAFEDTCGDKNYVASPTDSGVELDSRTFFEMARGKYTVLKSGVVKSREEDSREGNFGEVEVEASQAILAFSFCPPSGGCYPNYIFMDMAKTKIFQTPANNGSTSFTIVSEDGGKPVRYTWDVKKDGVITLKNYQYILDGKVVTLEHVIKKI